MLPIHLAAFRDNPEIEHSTRVKNEWSGLKSYKTYLYATGQLSK